MKKIYTLTLLLASVGSVYSQSETDKDDIIAHDLDEYVVQGENVWIEDGKYNFIPTKRAKNLSNSMEDLIDRMHTGVLFVEEGEIKSRNGQSVNIFINGVPVDNIDKSTFWAKNALRVEYIQFSNDPQFLGRTNIVNFVMKDYVAGGLTKLEADQQFPNEGEYSAASKLVWGKMTYNAMFKGGYSRDHQSGNETTEYYDGISYDGKFYDRVCRKEDAEIVNRTNNLYGGINARYRTEKFLMTHSVALQWNQNPESTVAGGISYNPEIISSDRMKSQTDGRSLSPSIEGSYTYTHSDKWTFGGNWNFSHSHNNDNSVYADSGLSPIVTMSRENLYSVNANLAAMWSCRDNLALHFFYKGKRTVSDVAYSGDVISSQWQSTGSNQLQVLGWWRVTNKMALQVTPEITLYDWHINHTIRKTQWLPGVNATLWWMINSKNNISLHSWYFINTPYSSMRNDLILRQTELKWVEGNPFVGTSSNYWLTLDYNSYPCSWFNQSFSFDFITHSNESYLSYRAGGTEYEGVIGQYMNAPVDRSYRVSWNFNLSLFNGDVSIGSQLYYNYQRVAGRGLNSMRVRPYVSWDFGNCSLTARCGTPERFYTQGGTQKVKTSTDYSLKFSYGNGNFIFDVDINSPFTKYYTKTVEMNNGPYHYTSRDWSNGRNISVSLTYTFDYGKKVTPGVEIYEQNIRSTSVLGSDK